MTPATRRGFAFRPSVLSALAAVMLVLAGMPAAAQDTTGVAPSGAWS